MGRANFALYLETLWPASLGARAVWVAKSVTGGARGLSVLRRMLMELYAALTMARSA